MCANECVAGMLDELVSVLSGVADELADVVDDSDLAAVATGHSKPDCHVESGPPSLLELSSQAVARHCSCATVEKHSSQLDERLLRQVVYLVNSLSERLLVWRTWKCHGN